MAQVSVPLKVLFVERQPFMHQEADGSVKGSAATPALQALDRAGIPYSLRSASPARILSELRERKGLHCSFGWYSTSERREFAKFSMPVSQDGPMVALMAKNAKPESATGLLENPQIKVLVKESIVYGPYLQPLLDGMKAQPVRSAAEYSQLIFLLSKQRADVLFLPMEEANFYLQQRPELEDTLKLVKFAEMPAGEKRHFMCSTQVDDQTIDKINAAIVTLRDAPR